MSFLSLEKFDCNGESTSVGVRWERWKRALLIYLEASNVDKDIKKRASLLHFADLDLQEVFYNIPGANIEPSDGVDVFEIAISKLDSYFAPKQSKIYERHSFRLLKQEPEEKFEKFLVRLRKQADKCQFADRDENIIDQITEKCYLPELRKKILQIGDEITLDRVITEANTLEIVNKQLEEFKNSTRSNGNQEVNKVDSKDKKSFYKPNNIQQGCGRCGNPRHATFDAKCPAREKTCLKCGLKGHFRQFCRTKLPQKRKTEEKYSQERKKGRFDKEKSEINQVSGSSNELTQKEAETEYVFHIDDDVEIDCTIGGVDTKMLIDSGCKRNLITEATWEIMKKNKVSLFNQQPNPNVTFTAYGSTTPLKIKGSFEARIQIGMRSETATFYVVTNGTRNLLGKTTAMSLGVLKIGLNAEVNQINTEKFPKFKNILIQLPIDDSIPPVSQPYRRTPIPLEAKIGEKIEELKQRDIIEPVVGSSKWVSPVVPVLKENGEIRLCVDMRRANEAIIRENHPLPTMDKLLPKMKNAKVFTKLDIKDAFHQIEIHPASRHITTFITNKGLFRYKRLMFGISCAPEIFQKTLEHMLLGCEGVVNYIDDILIYGKDMQEHDARVKKVMSVLKDNNVLVKEDKCSFGMSKVSFLGHELSAEGVRPLEKYISTIKEFRAPKTTGELRSFLGLINFVSKWIPNYATATEPLKTLLRNKNGERTDITDHWGLEQQRCFDSLKDIMTNIPSLGYYDVNDRTTVIADASPVGLGGVLVQIDSEDKPRIIAYGHKTLTDCERRYCQTEKEALALVWAVEHFHIFLYGKRFELITDHKPLEIIFGTKSKPCARIERWVMRLQSYSYKVVYQSGKTNIADSLSRLGKSAEKSLVQLKDDHICQIVDFARPRAVSLKEIIDSSMDDQEILNVKEGLYHNIWSDDVKLYKLFQNELCFHEGILLRGTRIVIPSALRKRVLDAAHEGHPGIVSMKARLRTKVWWPKCDKDAENIVKVCKGCTLVSAPHAPNPMKRRELPDGSWIDIAIDLMGPLPSGDHLLVVVDYYSRYKEVKICRKITSTEIVAKLKEIFSRLGNPTSITADNGRQFISEEFKSFLTERNITLFNTIPYWPQQNGEVERQNRDILKRLKISIAENKDWKESLLDYLTMYNSTPHSVTGRTPAELFFNRRFRDKLPMVNDTMEGIAKDSEVKDRDQERKERGKDYGDRKRKAEESDLTPGDKVYIKNMNRENKLSLNYNPETHTVENKEGGDITVRSDETGQIRRRNVVHLKKIQGEWSVCQDRNEIDDEEMNVET
ncbi:uncharacterized protein K02A2.6-like [Pectinophora gossypiella]|uniref:uncharacterized protein K02A2.6-like n=1 Tax=Pectinophora gossypiella TaxID=13191 RepID=UPI00214E5CAE|nr:uncharacterized protein K02A2.6-like [Pectinophora gossypiella]